MDNYFTNQLLRMTKRHPLNRPRCRRTMRIWARKLDWYDLFHANRPPIKMHVRNSPLFLKRLREKRRRDLTHKAMRKLARYYQEYLK